jgi:DNA-directed RNA polymerase subunit F
MPSFLAIHPLPASVTMEEGMPLAKKVIAQCTSSTNWVESWAQLDAEGKIAKIFCHWQAESAEAVKDALANVPEIPTEGVYPIATLKPEDFK